MPRHEFNDDSRGPRLQKILAEAGVGSRRACEAMIEAGDVTVNGQLIDALPAWVDPARDRIAVAGHKLKLPLVPVYVMLFKPKGTVTTNAEDEDRRRVIDLVDHPSGARLYPVGRLEVDASGLILLTNNGAFANALSHPRHGVVKVYEVLVAGQVTDESIQQLERGVYVHDRARSRRERTPHARLAIIKRDRNATLLRLELDSGRYPQIRNVMLAVGHPVKKIRRVQLGPLKLSGLQPGQWRDLLPKELSALKRSVTKSTAKNAAAAKKVTPRPTRKKAPPQKSSQPRSPRSR